MFNGVRYGLSLIGGCEPMSILIFRVSVCVKSESLFANKSLFFRSKFKISFLCSGGQFNFSETSVSK